MNCYPMAALERTMKIQEVILRALAKKITWWQAAEIIGITDRQMRRWHWRYRKYGYDGLLDVPSPSANISIRAGAFTLGLTRWVAITRRDGPACQRRSETGGGRLWKRC